MPIGFILSFVVALLIRETYCKGHDTTDAFSDISKSIAMEDHEAHKKDFV